MFGPVVIFFIYPLLEESIFAPSFKASYVRFAEFATERDIDLRFVVGEEEYEDGFFKSYWKYKQGEYTQIRTPFKAKIVYLRGRTHKLDKEKRVNNSFLEKICRDKLETAKTFPLLTKKTFLINEDTIDVVNNLSTSLVVLKPRYGSNGTDVKVLAKDEITKELLADNEYVIQDFIDSSDGLKGVISQRHEMRIYVFNGEIQSAYLRLPAPDSYLSNIGQGAKEKQIDNSQIPASAITLKNEVDQKFAHITPRQYAIDIMFEDEKPWIVELNDAPGFPDVAVQPLTDNYLHALLDLLVT